MRIHFYRITTAELVSYIVGGRAYPRLGDGGSKVTALIRSASTFVNYTYKKLCSLGLSPVFPFALDEDSSHPAP